MVSGSYGQWQSVVSVYVVWQCWSVVVSISWGSVGQWQWVYVVWSVAVLVSDQWQWSVAVSVSGEWHCRSVVRGSVGQWSVAGRQSVVSGSAGQCFSVLLHFKAGMGYECMGYVCMCIGCEWIGYEWIVYEWMGYE